MQNLSASLLTLVNWVVSLVNWVASLVSICPLGRPLGSFLLQSERRYTCGNVATALHPASISEPLNVRNASTPAVPIAQPQESLYDKSRRMLWVQRLLKTNVDWGLRSPAPGAGAGI